MSNPYFKYNPEPSQTMRQRGNIVEGSYLVCDGQLKGNEFDIKCEFEVALMQSGISYAVVYIEFAEEQLSQPYWDNERLKANIENSTELIGVDKLFNNKVKVELDVRIGQLGDIRFSHGIRTIYTVENFSTEVESLDLNIINSAVFHLANLPLNEHQYSPQRTVESDITQRRHEIEQQSLRAALEEVIANKGESSNSDDELLELGLKTASSVSEKLWHGSEPFIRNSITLKFKESIVAELQFLESHETVEYLSQPMTRLIVYKEQLPEDWTFVDASEWICNLLSIAIGRMVIWNYYYLPPATKNAVKSLEHWESRTLLINRFDGLTEKNNRLIIHGLYEESHAVIFVEQCLEFLFEQEKSATDTYGNSIYDYIYYASVSQDKQHKCTLFCAVIEKLVKDWINISPAQLENEFERVDRTKIPRAIRASVEEILPRSENEPDILYQQRVNKFNERVSNTIGYGLSKGLGHSLNFFFEQHSWNLPLAESIHHNMRTRIELFVDSRNKLFHEHRFYHDNEEKFKNFRERQRGIWREIENIEMLVPLMFATILGYRARYWDKMTNGWQWMPRNSED